MMVQLQQSLIIQLNNLKYIKIGVVIGGFKNHFLYLFSHHVFLRSTKRAGDNGKLLVSHGLNRIRQVSLFDLANFDEPIHQIQPKTALGDFGVDVSYQHNKIVVSNNIPGFFIRSSFATFDIYQQDADGQWAFGQSDPGDPSLVTLPGDASSKPTKSSIENNLANINSTIYPVPTIGIINLDFVSNYYETSKLELFNSNGNLVFTENIESNIGQNKWTLNLNNHSLNNGVYFLVLRNRYYNIRKRIIFSN